MPVEVICRAAIDPQLRFQDRFGLHQEIRRNLIGINYQSQRISSRISSNGRGGLAGTFEHRTQSETTPIDQSIGQQSTWSFSGFRNSV